VGGRRASRARDPITAQHVPRAYLICACLPPPRPAPQWVCADCGYVYDKQLFGGKYFEEQGYGFKCPQCSGPRRRYAKMVGNTVGVTLDGGDGPILLFSGVGFAITIAFAVWVSLARRRLEFAIVAR